jgi:hypothetical protein
MSKEARLKGNAKRRSGPHPLGEFPSSLAVEIGRHIVHRLAVGQEDITGDDFGVIFAAAISGQHRGKPLGIADVEWDGCAWSIKTVQDERPFEKTSVRVISGRNSPVYSGGISDPFADIQATGRAVLDVWNARVNEALNTYDDLRILVLIRNMTTLEFTIFEHEATRYVPTEYGWTVNKQGNFEATDEQKSHRFTWQPHGSQFTTIHHVPKSAYRFRIKQRPAMLEEGRVLELVGFKEDWIEEVIISENPHV